MMHVFFVICQYFFFLADEGYLKKFFQKTKDMTPDERGQYLQDDDVSIKQRL